MQETLPQTAPAEIDCPAAPRGHLLRRAGFILIAAACLTPWATPPLALAAGAAFALTLGHPFEHAGRRATKLLLQACVVLLGFQMDFGRLVEVGAGGWVLAAGSIALTLGLGWAAGRALRLGRRTSLLISAGTAICGGSAIAAVAPVIDADDHDMAVALGTVFSLNAVALYLFPPIGHALGLTADQFGMWSGIAIHDISSVVGASAGYAPGALAVATAVKLSRTLWIVPVTLGAAWAARRRAAGAAEPREGEGGKSLASSVAIPWFIALFVLASLARLASPHLVAAAPAIGRVARAGLTLTLFGIGAGLTRRTLRAAGWRALAQGVFLWTTVTLTSLAVILHV